MIIMLLCFNAFIYFRLMVSNPLLLYQLLVFVMECIFKAHAETMLEMFEIDQTKVPAKEWLISESRPLTSIFNILRIAKLLLYYYYYLFFLAVFSCYDEMLHISGDVGCHLFAFEHSFLRKFSVSWLLTCQRLYQIHVFRKLADTLVICVMEVITKYNPMEKNTAYISIK